MAHTQAQVAPRGAGASGGARQQNPPIERLVGEIMNRIEETLKLDPRTVAYIYEHEREDKRFEFADIGEGEFFMRIGPVECVKQGEEGCHAEVALTVSEAVALAIRLIRYAAMAYEKEKKAEA